MADPITDAPWRVERRGRNVHYVILDACGSDWEQWFLLSGDRHIDSSDSDREMQLRHLRQAKGTASAGGAGRSASAGDR